MQNAVLGLLAETFIHPGSGSSEGAIDLPVAREAATDFPFIPGSSLKGALKDMARRHWADAQPPDGQPGPVSRLFGEQSRAGALLVGDARLLLLPVRSLSGAYRWATCALLLERFSRDRRRGLGRPRSITAAPPRGEYLGHGDAAAPLYLEERTFRRHDALPDDLTTDVGELIAHDATRARLNERLVVLHDDDFAWFARYGLPVQARNQLDEANKISENLWYEETLPPDTLLYTVLGERMPAVAELVKLFDSHPYLQAGGNETVGQGWFAVQPLTGVAP